MALYGNNSPDVIQLTQTLTFQYLFCFIIKENINKVQLWVMQENSSTLRWINAAYTCGCQSDISKWFTIYVKLLYIKLLQKVMLVILCCDWQVLLGYGCDWSIVIKVAQKMGKTTIIYVMFLRSQGTTQLTDQEFRLILY
jgi:hypothetical protein